MTLFNLLPFLAPENLALAIAMRFLMGLCTAVLFLAAVKIFAILAPPDQMAKAQGFYGGAFGFGTMLPYFTLPYLRDWGWGWSYLITGALFVVAFVAALLPPREALRPPRQGLAAGDGPGIGELLVRTFKAPDLWMMGLLHGIFYGTLNTLGQWLPAVLADLDGVPLKEWALAATLALFLGSCSRTLSGYFLKLVSRKMAICLCLFVTLVLYAGLGAAGNAHIGLVLGLCLALVCGLCHGTIFAMGGLILPPAFMSTALGFLNSLANLFNVGLTLSFGYLRDATGSFGPALYLTGAVALATLLLLRRRIARLDERLR
jgi:MFS family permease